MIDSPLETLELERHLRLLRGSDAGALAVCDASGRLLASWTGEGGASIEALLAELGEDALQIAESEQALRRMPVGAEGPLLQAPILDGAGQPAGWLNAVPGPDADESALGTRLRDAAAALSGELRLRQEMDGLVADLGARHEELNLVYDVDRRTRSFLGNDAEIEGMLASFADHVQVDVAALVLSDRAWPIWSAKTRRISDVDLLLTQLRGDVLRFVSVSRESLLLSHEDDLLRGFVFANLPYHLIACPVEIGNQIAMLALVRVEDDEEFSNSDRNLASMVASQAGLILRNHAMTRSLETFSAQMAAALIEAIEAKDPYTRGHSERVQAVSVDLARAASLPGRGVEGVSWGALLHDVGKIGVPDQILCKRGALTRDEYTLIKIHPERSYEILRHIEGLDGTALAAARYHQEKYDGSGYPHGLAGPQIPLEARIVSVADTYDAITSSRSYRPGLGHEVALARIVESAGNQLDPWLVTLFERLCEERPAWLKRSGAGEGDG